jgi:hypothetical protein
MTEETQTTETIEPQDTGVSQYIDADGTFKDGWKENLLPEEMRKEGTWDRFSNLQDVFKSESEARKLVSKKGIIPPTEKSTPDEWNAFYKALGRPDTPEEYGLKRPDAIPEEMWDDELLTSAMKTFHEAGAPAPLAKKMFDWYNQRTLDAIKDMEHSHQEAEVLIRGESGNKYDEIAHDGHKLMQDNLEGLPEPIKEGIIREINDPKVKPYLFFLLANIQHKFDEDTVRTGGQLPGAKGIQQKIDELRSDPAFLDLDRKDPAKHKRILDEINSLTEQKMAMQSKG